MCPGRGRAGSVPEWGRRGRGAVSKPPGGSHSVRVELPRVNGGATAKGDEDRRPAGFEELPEPVRRTVGAWCVPGKEARQLDVGRPVWRRVHHTGRRTDKIRITRLDRDKERVASARKPEGDACCIHGRVKRSPNVPTRSPPSTTTDRSAHGTARKPYASWARQRVLARDQAGKTLNVAHRVAVNSAAIGLASTVGCETSKSASSSEPRRSSTHAIRFGKTTVRKRCKKPA